MRAVATSTIDVKIARFNEPTVEVKVKKGSSVEEALEKANKSLGSAETMWVNGQEAGLEDVIEDGDLLQIVGSKSGGSR